MTDSNDSRMVRLPVRNMRDETKPQRAAQEGDLPPLLTDEQILRAIHSIGQDGWGRIALTYESGPYDIDKPTNVAIRLARAIESEVRTAIAAAGGGVPQPPPADEQWLEIFNAAWMALTPKQREAALADTEASHPLVAACRMLASSPQPEAEQAAREFGREFAQVFPGAQPEAAPAVAQVPREALMEARDMLESWTSYVPPYFAQKHGLSDDFAKLDAWIAAAAEAPAQAAPSAGEVERDRKDAERYQKCRERLRWQLNPSRVLEPNEVDEYVDQHMVAALNQRKDKP